MMIELLFFLALFLAVYPYLVYPLVLTALARVTARPTVRRDWTPKVSILIPAYNEEAVIEKKIENTLALDYPTESVEVLIGSDGSDDGTVAKVEPYLERVIRLLPFSERRGKPSVISDLAAQSTGEILVLTDASAMLDRTALRELISAFGSDDIGVVSGEMVPDSGKAMESSMGFYRRSDNRLRRLESAIHSSTGAAGAIYAIRRELFLTLPPDVILDDFVIPLRCVLRGYRVLICREGRFTEIDKVSLSGEFRRKVRTLAGNYQALRWLWPLLVPGRSPIWFQLLSHKYMRLWTPLWMLALVPLNIALLPSPLFSAALAAQVAFYIAAGLGYWLRNSPRRVTLLHLPFLFLTMQVASAWAPLLLLTGRVSMRWTHERSFTHE